LIENENGKGHEIKARRTKETKEKNEVGRGRCWLMVEKINKYKADPTPGGISHTTIGDPRPPGEGPGEHSRDF
jgi:hypothetical protein